MFTNIYTTPDRSGYIAGNVIQDVENTYDNELIHIVMCTILYGHMHMQHMHKHNARLGTTMYTYTIVL